MSIKSFISHLTRYDKLTARIDALSAKSDIIIRQQHELLMAQKYHDTVADYEWLKHRGISPGGWAVDYAFCYTLARALNAMRPQHILECGLGQSSRIVHQYACFYKINAVTCEHDQEWIDFLREEAGANYPITIKKVELEQVKYKGEETLSYKNIQSIFAGERFDFMLIDGPFGSSHYSRSQTIELCKNNLAERFCIIIDDTERSGEKETVEEVKGILDMSGIEYAITEYTSTKSHTLICSKKLAFLTSM